MATIEVARQREKAVIWKYALPAGETRFTLSMPKGAEVLDAQLQYGEPVLWTVFDPGDKAPEDAEHEPREFMVLNTGEMVEDDAYVTWGYVATLQFFNGTPVKHLFQRLR